MDRSVPTRSPARPSPYQEGLPQNLSSSYASQRSNATIAATPQGHYFSPSPYNNTSVGSALHASAMNNTSRSSAGPRMLAPPKAVQSIYAGYAPPARTRAADEQEAAQIQALNVANLKLLESLDRANPVSKLPPAMYETDTKCYVQGFKKADGILMVRGRTTTKPVHFRECAADGNQTQVLAFHVEGASDAVVIDACRRMRVLVDSVIRKVLLVGCHDVEIVIGGVPPQVVLVSCTNCCIATSKDDWLSEIETVGCSGVSVLIAKAEDGNNIMPVQSILNAPDLERVLLPDALLTAVRKGTVATQCHYVDEAAVPPLLAPRGDDPASSMPPQTDEAPAYSATTHESSQFKVEYVSSICTVGLLIANDHIGTRVTAVEDGSSADLNGRIKERDYLMAVDGVDIRGYPVQEIHTLLMGPQGTTTTVGMCRLAPDGALVEGYDVVLTRMPYEKKFASDAHPIPQELPTPYYNRREPAQPLQASHAMPRDASPPFEMPAGASPAQVTPWRQPRQDPNLTPTQPVETKSWKWTPKAPTPGNLGGIPSVWKDKDKETDEVLKQTAKPLPPAQGVIYRSGVNSSLNKSTASNASLYASGLGDDGQFRSAGIGLAVQQGPMGLYAISAVVPGGPADTSGQIKKGDIVHSVNGTVLAGKPPAAFKDLVWGVPGSEVMLALLRPEAQPEDMYKELTEFEWWRPVILIRSHRTRPVPDGVAVPPALPGDVLVNQSGASVFRSVPAPNASSVSAMPSWRPDQSLGASRGIGDSMLGSSNAPPAESFVSAAGRVTLEGPSGRQMSAGEGVGVALWLDEDMREVAGTKGDEASFRARLVHDLSSCLAVRARQINIAGLQSGSVIAQVELHPCEDGRDDRTPMQLAGELVHQATAQDSRLRSFRSTRRATMAKIMGPLSALRPDQQVDPLAMPSLAPSGPPQSWQPVASPVPDSIMQSRDEGRGLLLRSQASAGSPYQSRANASPYQSRTNGSRLDESVSRSLHITDPNITKSRSYSSAPAAPVEPPGKRLLSGVLAGKQREAGIGLGLGQRDGAIEVASMVPGEAASESGEVFEGNLLVSVDDLPLRQMSMEQVLSLVNGPAGSRVKLGLVRLAGTTGGMPDQDVMVTVELVRGENEKVREAQREKEMAEQLRREEWMRAQAERTDQLRKVAQREQERLMLREQEEMAELLRSQNMQEPPESAVRYTGPSRIVALTRKFDPIRQRVGLGMSLTSVHPSGEILIAGLPEGGAAFESRQVVVGDVIHKVDNKDVKGKKVAEVVEMIRGEQGTAAVLLVQGTTLDPTALDPTLTSSSMYTSRDLGANMGGNVMARVALTRLSPSLSTMPQKGEEMQGGLGIGLGLTKDGVHFVNGLMEGGSAERSGQVQKGDRIIAIDDVHTTGRTVAEVINLVRGRVGSTAVVTLERGAMLSATSRPQYEGTPGRPFTANILSDLDTTAQAFSPPRQMEPVPERPERFDLEEVPKPVPSPPHSGGQPSPPNSGRYPSPRFQQPQSPQQPEQPNQHSPSPIPMDRDNSNSPAPFPPHPDLKSQTPAERGMDILASLPPGRQPSPRQPSPPAIPEEDPLYNPTRRKSQTIPDLKSRAARPDMGQPDQNARAVDLMQPDQGSRAVDLMQPDQGSRAVDLMQPDQAARALDLGSPGQGSRPMDLDPGALGRTPVQAPERYTADQGANARTPVQDPERTPIQDPGRTPIQDPGRTPVQEPMQTPEQQPQRLDIPINNYPPRVLSPPTPPKPVPEFHKPPTPPPSHGAGVATPGVKDPRATQTYNVRVVSASEMFSASPDPELIQSTIAVNLKATHDMTGAVLADLETVVEGTLNDDGTATFRGVATDITVNEADVPMASLQLDVWDLAGGDRGCLGECKLPLSKLPLGKDLKVTVPIDEPEALPPQGWIGQAAGNLYLRILSREPDLGWAA